MYRFLHAADLHLDSPLIGLDRYEGAPVERIRAATREALKNLTRLALRESVAFVLIAGDLFDGEWKDYNTGLFFADQMRRLREAAVPVFIVSGNHDAASQVSKSLRMPDNVRMFSATRPETHRLDELGVAVHGQGFARPAVTEDLASGFPRALPGRFNIGLLHTSTTGRPGHAPYAPCAVETLRAKGYDYWALGHVHRREILSSDPPIVYPGNTQGRHVRESGPKGCMLVTVDDSQGVSHEPIELDVVRWAIREVRLDGIPSPDALLDEVAASVQDERQRHADRLLAVRFQITGTCGPTLARAVQSEGFVHEVRAVATDAGAGEVWVESVKVRPRIALELEALMEQDDALGGLLRSIRDLRFGAEAFDRLTSDWSDLRKRLPQELLHGADPLDLDTDENRREILDDVRQILLSRLMAGGS